MKKKIIEFCLNLFEIVSLLFELETLEFFLNQLKSKRGQKYQFKIRL
jgi:hypothetical protein